MRCTKPTSRNSKEDFRSDEMKLKDIQISFYKRCDCKGVDDVEMWTIRDILTTPPPECSKCGMPFDFDEEAEIWDTF